MEARFRSWWQQIKQRRVAILVVVIILVVAIALFIVEIRVYGTGFTGKTLWDWLQLLIIPLALAIIALVFQRANSRTEQQIAKDRYDQDRAIAKQRYEQDQQIALDKQREDLLQAYLDRMAELLLKEKLRSSEVDAEVRNVARVRTITVLTQLDARRIGYVFAFLREAGIMSTTSNDNVVSLSEADLRAVNWSQANLSDANLSKVILSKADLSKTILSGATFSKATLEYANLSDAFLFNANLSDAFLFNTNLNNADLSQANFSGAYVTDEQLAKAKSLIGATMPDGSKHP